MANRRFPVGSVVITVNAKDTLHPEDVQTCLGRHSIGDWGEVCEADQKENELSIDQQLRLFSVYRDRCQTKFWIITEADRSVTTILLPEDY